MGNNFSALLPHRPAALIKVAGEDAATFLQGQFTNDLRGKPGATTYGLWLNQKGRVLADSYVLRLGENDFLMVSMASEAAVIRERLEQYVIADDVTLTDETATGYGLSLWGEGAAELVQKVAGVVPKPAQFVAIAGGWIFSGQRTDGKNFELIGSEKTVAEWQAQGLSVGGVVVGTAEAEAARITAGIPAIPRDIGLTDLPNEAGLENSAISFTKGCYLGQEVMARLKNLGQVRRQLRRVRGSGPAPANGTPLFQKARKAGEIRSAIATSEGFIGWAMVTRMGLEESLGFGFAPSEEVAEDARLWTS